MTAPLSPAKLPAAASALTHGAPCSAINLTVVEAGDQVLITAPADSMTPAEFLRRAMAVFAPAPSRESERADAARIYIGKVFAGEDAGVARAEMHTRFDEIDARYLHREVMVNAKERY
jgi:hypothetical protein